MGILKIFDGATWVTAIAKTWDGAAWSPKMKFYDGVEFIPLYPESGDTVQLLDLQADTTVEEPSNAHAEIQVYSDDYPTRKAEAWYDLDGSNTKHHDVVDPPASLDSYQMKWDWLSGDYPTTSTVAEGVWHAFSGGAQFSLKWSEYGTASQDGYVTVSIRKGTGAVLDTAAWRGDADVTSA